MNNRYTRLCATLIMAFTLTELNAAQTIRDYYAEPGLHPFSEKIEQQINESINPFSGGLSIKHTDVNIPGNGGLDITINRVYHSRQVDPGPMSRTGLGWTVHMGRIVVDEDDASKICSQGSNWSITSLDNPSIEFSDGSREVLYLATSDYPEAYLITKSFWKAECNSSGNGMTVTSPDGVSYTMDKYGKANHADGEVYWYTTYIEDQYGNYIDIEYESESVSVNSYIDLITSSDGRSVDFIYEDTVSGTVLSKIITGSQIWEYKYTSISGLATGYVQLTKVIRPDSTEWNYDYHPNYSDGSAGSHSLSQITYPHGANISYEYDFVNFDPQIDLGAKTTVVAKKDVVGPSVSPPVWTWTFDYVPGYSRDAAYDKTTINAPNGRYEYYHWGYSGTASGSMWKVGLIKYKEVYEGNTLIQQLENEWDGILISHENYNRGRTKFDNDIYKPVQTKKWLWTDQSSNETQYTGHDKYGNPATVTEIANFESETPDVPAKRVTAKTYYNDSSSWILGMPEKDTIENYGEITRTYYPTGKIKTIDRFGVITAYEYTANGDIAKITDPRSKVTIFDDYFRGIPQTENHPESVTITREVNSSGTVGSETNGRGIKTIYSYDNMNRLEGIDYPINDDVSISRNGNTRTLNRGVYKRVDTLGGFGRVIETTHEDTDSGDMITLKHKFDVFGNKIFESYSNSDSGDQYEYDVLNRIKRITHPDDSYVTIGYRDPADVEGRMTIITDENGNTTKKLYGAYGDTSESWLMKVVSPGTETPITHITRDKLGKITEIYQTSKDGQEGTTRTFIYDSRKYLETRIDPEKGATTYIRDDAGNMESKQVGSESPIEYTYDDLGRLEFIDYPSGSNWDVTYTYDANSNVKKIVNSYATREYWYDYNDNLEKERQLTSANTLLINYTIDGLDNIQSIEYPSGRTVDYSPDAFGRPTSALPYIQDVEYHPNGTTSRIEYSNGRIKDIAINGREWIERIHDHNATSIVDLAYTYDYVGNVGQISDAIESQNSITMGYDELNRLTAADGPWGEGLIAYDVFGNIKEKTLGDSTQTYAYTNQRLSHIYRNGESLGPVQYDAYGSFRSWGNPLNAFFPYYDYYHNSAGYLYAVRRDNTLYSYRYDGEGGLVKTDADGQSPVIHMLRKNGQLIGDYDEDGDWKSEYVYLNGKSIAKVSNVAPVASVQTDSGLHEGDTGTLDASSSHAYGSSIQSYQWTQTGGPSAVITNTSASSTTFTAPQVAEATQLQFQLTVTDEDGMTASTEFVVEVWDSVPPSAVSNINIKQGVDSNTIQWSPNAQADSYTIYWSTTKGFDLSGANNITGITNTEYTHTSLVPGETYYYAIVGENQFGESIDYKEVSSTPNMNDWGLPYSLDEIPSPVEGKDIQDIKIVDHPSGKMLAVWVQDLVPGYSERERLVYASWFDVNTGWTSPQVISGSLEASQYDDSFVIDVNNTSGDIAVAWAFGGINIVRYDATTSGWSEPETFNISVYRDLSLSLGNDESIIIAWIGTAEYGILRAYASIYDPETSAWSAPAELGDNSHINAAISDSNGSGIVVIDDGFMSYDPQTGEWSWLNEHYRYGYDWDYETVISNSSGDLMVFGIDSSTGDTVSKRYSQSSSWSAPDIINTSGDIYGVEGHLYSDGDALITWIDYVTTNSVYHSEVYSSQQSPGSAWSTPYYHGIGHDAAVVGSTTGTGVIYWTNADDHNYSLYSSVYSYGDWQGPMQVKGMSSSDGFVNTTSVAIDASGNISMLWSDAGNNWSDEAAATEAGIWANHYWNLGGTALYPDASPTCAYGRDYTAQEGQTLELLAYGYDSDGTISEYSWEQVSGVSFNIHDDTSNPVLIDVPLVGEGDEDAKFKAVLHDDSGNTCQSYVAVDVARIKPPAISNIESGDKTNILTIYTTSGANAASYNIYWSSVPGVTPDTGNKISNIIDTTYTHDGLNSDQRYYYIATKVNDYGVESDASDEVSKVAVNQIWSDPMSVTSRSAGYPYPELAMWGNGDAYAVYEAQNTGTDNHRLLGSRYLHQHGWQPPELVNTLPDGVDTVDVRYSDVAININGDMVVVWEQRDPTATGPGYYDYSVWARVYDSSEGWQDSYALESQPYSADDVAVVLDDQGDATVAWSQQNAEGNMNIAVRRYSFESGWTESELIDVDQASIHWSETPKIVTEGAGRVVVVWERWNESYPEIWARRYDSATGWETATRISADGEYAEKPSIASDGNGSTMIIWHNSGISYNDLMYSSYEGSGAWSQPALVETRDEYLPYDYFSSISMNDDGDAVAAWWQANKIYTNLYDSQTQSWEGAVQVNDLSVGEAISYYDTQRGPRVELSNGGQAIVVWSGYLMDRTAGIFSSYYQPGEGWLYQRNVSRDAEDGPFDVGIDDLGNALITWGTDTLMWSSIEASSVVTSNTPPIADAGLDLVATEGDMVTLDGSGSTDLEGPLSFNWQQTDGPSVAMIDPNTATPYFTSPLYSDGTSVSFALTVVDAEGLSDIDVVNVQIEILDTDNDGMSDLWEQQYFSGTSIAPDGDADGDGVTNIDEYLQQSNPTQGDINFDGMVNVADLLLAQRHVLGLTQLNPSQEAAFDLAPNGGNGEVNAADLLLLQQRVLNAH